MSKKSGKYAAKQPESAKNEIKTKSKNEIFRVKEACGSTPGKNILMRK